ncbi:MAG TPA: transcriptional regulator [Lentisphaeria bacterium]|nr:MAG: transcriptional regulator [Lentisphaerae bacterium GWF2_50_93]HCE46969.1 transcriptional regulator [Lentisphaeria bacterium]
MNDKIKVKPKVTPVLDPGFTPAVLWNREYGSIVEKSGRGVDIAICLERTNGSVSVFRTKVLPDEPNYSKLNLMYVERLVKYLLWMKGGWKITIAGSPKLAGEISGIYSKGGDRKFDNEIMGEKIYGKEMLVASCELRNAPAERETAVSLGGNLDGCRIGFDLGGSDRKCAAVIDGNVVFTEEIPWDPYFQKDPSWHKAGINETLKKAAAHLPRVDAIGGSSAGVYVDNQVRVASLFRGVSKEDFKSGVRSMFIDLQKEWNVPFIVVNDGEVTALAGAMSLNDNSVLGISMGTSLAAGYVTPAGNITDWLNELAFAPIDYSGGAPVDEWSGDRGCGVQYFSQQAVARLASPAGINFPSSTPFAEQLIEVQRLMKADDPRARKIYNTIGTCFGYAVAQYAQFYEIKNLLFLGRVSSGAGGEIIISKAQEVLKAEFPELAGKINFRTPDEKMKRHGQAVAAASLPKIKD